MHAMQVPPTGGVKTRAEGAKEDVKTRRASAKKAAKKP